MAQFNGTSGNDILVGSSGADILVGLRGNDTYTVNHVGDVVVERRNQGTDLIFSSVSYTLPDHVEVLGLVGSSALNATGNTLNNILFGNGAANRLDGSAGSDLMAGGGGDDHYVVESGGDIVLEGAGQGTDTVRSFITYALGANLEDIELAGTGAIDGTGNGLDNVITGNAADNSLNGGGSDDTIDGRDGFDTAIYSGAFSDYQITPIGLGFSVNDLRIGSPDGTDMAISIESLRFSDVTIDVEDLNSAPVATDDAVAGNEDTPITTGNVLANDSDAESILTASSITGFTQGTHGAVIYNNDATFTYTPNANFNGSDSFDYTITDGALTSTATVHVTVDPVNDAPVAVADTNSDDAVVEAATLDVFPSVDLAGVANGTGGFRIVGESGGDLAGASVARLGDVDEDGRPDLLIGAYENDAEGSGAGAAYVVFGNADVSDIDLAQIAIGTGGFKIIAESAGDQLTGGNQAVSSLGDVNSDGHADFLLGAYQNGGGGPESGAAYVVYGKSGGAPVDLAQVATGVGGYKIVGEDANDQVGFSVSRAGDVNGDGRADMVIGTINGDAGVGGNVAAYVVFGKAGNGLVDLDAVATGTGGFTIFNVIGGHAGKTVTGLGDVNGDTFADVLIGAPFDSAGGAAYVVFGKAGSASVDLDRLTTDNTGFKIIAESAGGMAGWSLAGLGDVNGDTFADMLLGAPGNNAAYVVFGKDDSGTVNLGAIGQDGFKIVGESQASQGTGFGVSTIGDVNGDGRPEFLIGALLGNAAYVVFGTDDASPIELDDVAQGFGGFKMLGAPGDSVGTALSGLGDLNGDGVPEVLVGAHGNNGGTGAAYVVFSPIVPDDPGDPTAEGDVLTNDSDADPGDTLNVVGVQAGEASGPLSTGVGGVIPGIYGTLTLTGDGAYNYTLDNDDPDTEALGQGDTGADLFSYTIADGTGATATTTLTIDIGGSDDTPPALGLGEVLGPASIAADFVQLTPGGNEAAVSIDTASTVTLLQDMLTAGNLVF